MNGKKIEDFAHANEEFLRGYLELPWGIPSHDTIQRVMAAIDPKYMQAVVIEWNEIINSNEGEKLKKINPQKHSGAISCMT